MSHLNVINKQFVVINFKNNLKFFQFIIFKDGVQQVALVLVVIQLVLWNHAQEVIVMVELCLNFDYMNINHYNLILINL